MATTAPPVGARTAGGRPATSAEEGGGSRKVWRALGFGLLFLLTLAYLLPLLWMVLTTFKTQQEATRWPLQWLPDQFLIESYRSVARNPNFPVLRWFANSLVVASLHALLVIALAAPAAYALARMDFRGKRLLFGLILSTLFIPPLSLIVPNFIVVRSVIGLDNLATVIVPGAASAFGVFFLRQFFLGLPRELEEAGMVDGAKPYEIFFRIILPMSRPALATLVVLSFLTNWNDFLWPVYVLFSQQTLTLPPGLAQLQGNFEINYPVLMAGAVVASVPVLILFTFAQRFIIEGVASSGIKG